MCRCFLVFLAAGGTLAVFSDVSLSGVTGSPHDFSATGPLTQSSMLAPGGSCSVCHAPHGSSDIPLWPRDLSGYRSKLILANGRSSLTGHNYLLSYSVQCYDCHDFHGSTDFENPSTPALSVFNTNHRPQDVLFGFTKNSLGNMTEFNAGSQAGKGTPGYYENDPPGSASNFGVNTAALPGQSGGHYFKQDPTTAQGDAFDNGDKLPCSDCHDPHAWDPLGSWQAFFRNRWPANSPVVTRIGSNAIASSRMANDSTPTSKRSDSFSRNLCIACHGNSDMLLPVNFPAINELYVNNVPIVRPPPAIAEHASGSQVACVTCHAHNSIAASCNGCHGYPPSDTASPRYPSTAASSFIPSPDPGPADSHPRHYGSKSGQASNSFSVYSFSCEVCHFGSAGQGAGVLNMHNNGLVSVILQGAYTRFPNGPGGAYDNTNYYNQGFGLPPARTGQLDNTATSTGWGLGVRYGGNSCQNVYCHSGGRAQASMADNDYQRPVWNSGSLVCNGCHGIGTDNVTAGGIYYGMPNYLSGPSGSDNANTHKKHVDLGYECSVCHAGTVTGAGAGRVIPGLLPTKHVNGIRDVAFGGGATGTYDNTPALKTCHVSCHGSDAPQWGGPSRTCGSCHLGTGDTDLYQMQSNVWFTSGVAGSIDNTEWYYSGHGKTGGTYDVSGRPAANLLGGGTGDNPCIYCHDPSVGHRVATNPFRLKQQDNVTGFAGLGWNATCLVCHRKTLPRPGYDPDGAATVYANKVATAAFVDTGHYGSKHAADNTDGGRFCWDCHDPHGDRANATTGNLYMIQKVAVSKSDGVYGYRGTAGTLTAPVSFRNDNAISAGGEWARADLSGLCQVCHNTTVAHFYNTTGGYDPNHNPGTRCIQCHTHDGNFEARCVDCHRDSNKIDNTAPTIVWPGGNRSPVPPGTVQGSYGSHLVGQKNDPAFGASTDWNAQCNKCHSGHGGAVQVPMPPTNWTDPSVRLSGTNMAQRIGLDNYAVDNGIRLGGSATTGATEAEICWNCHGNAANNVSEWGPGDNNVALAGFPVVKFSTLHDGTPSTFDYGWIYTDNTFTTKTADWTAGYWRDEYSWGTDNGSANLKRRIVSVHTASFDTAGQSSSVAANVKADNTINYASPTLENKSYIRCSYCHDVHDLNRAVDPFNTTQKEAKSGPPYLRGTFISNPYPPDMTPRGTPGLGGNTYPTTGGPTQGTQAVGNRFQANTGGQVFADATPRLFAFTYTTISKGGYFIDLNSGNPTTGQTFQGTAGLCALCHGTNVDTMKFYPGSNLWAKTNGHSNASLGGTGTNAAELFDARRLAFGSPTNTTGKFMEMQDGINTSNWGINVGYSSNDQAVGANWNVFGAPQPCNGNAANCPPKNSGWYGGTAGSQTAGTNFVTWYGGTTPPKPAHTYTCSKCHMPHASGLPALLATNCLDIGLSNWSANGGRVGPNNGTGRGSRGPANCHRKTATEQGWNRLAPKQTQ